MATMFTRTLSEPNAPAAASPESAAAAIRTRGANIANVLKLGGEVYGGYRELDIERASKEASAAREQFFQSNENAFIQQQDYQAAQKRVQEEQTKQAALQGIQGPLPEEQERIVLERIAAGKGALEGFTNEAQRLQEAYKAGMSNAEYTTRIAAITKKAIAKYPSLSDQIRQQISKVSGLPGADEFASFSYVQRAFGDKKEKKDESGYSKEDFNIMSEATGLLVGDIVALQNQDPAKFAQAAAAGRSLTTSRFQSKAVQQTLDTKAAEGNLTAEENKPIFQHLARTNFHNAISTLVLKKPEVLNVFFKQTEGTAPAADQIDTANKMFQAIMKQQLDSSKVITMRQIDEYAQKSSIPFQKREEIKKLVQEEYDNTLALFSDPDAGAAIAGVMKNHMKESASTQIKLMELNIAILSSVAGTKFREAWLNSDAAGRAKLERDDPRLSQLVRDAENQVLTLGTSVKKMLEVANGLKVVSDTIKDAKTTPEATPSPQRTRLTDEAVASLAQGALDRYKKDKKPSPEDVNALSTFLSNANNGAGFPTLRANETVIRDFMASVTEQEKPAVFRAVEKSYGTELQSRVIEWDRVSKKEGWNFPVVFTADGGAYLVDNVGVKPSRFGTLTNVPPAGQPSPYASAEEWQKYREATRAGTPMEPGGLPAGSQRVESPEFVLAREYFNKTILPRIIASTTVRSVVTGEPKAVSAKYAADALNEKKFSNYAPFMQQSQGRTTSGPTAQELSDATAAGAGQSGTTGGTLAPEDQYMGRAGSAVVSPEVQAARDQEASKQVSAERTPENKVKYILQLEAALREKTITPETKSFLQRELKMIRGE